MENAPKDYKYKLHNYPYWYRCKCGSEFKIDQKKEEFWKDGYDIFSEEPLAFECKECRDAIVKPIGYVTPENWENFKIILPPTKEEIAEWDEMFGPLDE